MFSNLIMGIRLSHRDRRFLARIPWQGRSLRWPSFVFMAGMMMLSTITLSWVFSAALVQASETSLGHRPPAAISQAATPAEVSPRRGDRLRRRDIWKAVEEALPNLPREVHGASGRGGAAADSEPSTLSRRLIEYHNFRKGRSPISRFDWKLTLGDYLGIHEPMSLVDYPGSDTLSINPLAGDRAAIRSLSPDQRNTLVNTLVRLHNPQIPDTFFEEPAKLGGIGDRPASGTSRDAASPKEAAPTVVPASQPVQLPLRPGFHPLPQPGDAELLRPR